MDEMMMMEGEMPEGGMGEQAGFLVELYVKPDGSMSINVESGEEEAEQHGGAMPEGTPVKSLEEAISMIIDIVKNGGQVEDAMAGQDEFNAGYGDGAMEEQRMTGAEKRFG